jgi:cytochrome c oxidase cbb3-type subunit I
MEPFMNRSFHDEAAVSRRPPQVFAIAAWHSLLWLVIANAIGVMIAVLLLAPRLNNVLGEWTYGRWIRVHMNLELYGWTALPLLGFLFAIYGADHGSAAKWCRPVLWVWSIALGVGGFSWLSGQSSGKLFLDWSGYSRVLFPAALIALWVLLLGALISNQRQGNRESATRKLAKVVGLAILLAAPFLIYAAAGPGSYPAVNPDTGGPTGTSQLESSLAVVAILLLLPFGLTRFRAGRAKTITIAWGTLLAEGLLCAMLSREDISHHLPAQYLSLGSLLVWLPLTPAYYAAFQWNSNTRRWRLAFLWWWAALIVTGWVFFLPGVLDHFKFTDGLVGHSFVAMAGFTSSLIIFVMVQLLGEGGWIFNRSRSFYLWHASVIAYIVVMTIAGWREGFDPSFTIISGSERNVLYTLRLLTGILMLIASVDWFLDASTLLIEPVFAPANPQVLEEKTA